MKKIRQLTRLDIIFGASFLFWLISVTYPFIDPDFIMNGSCMKYLGCIDGFFGFDAVQHFLFGIALLFTIFWLCKRYPEYSILPEDKNKRWKTALTLIAYVVFISVLWEFLECAHDYYNVSLLHQDFFNYTLHIDINYLDQPTNLDTMGDLFFSAVGTIVALFIYLVSKPEKEIKIKK